MIKHFFTLVILVGLLLPAIAQKPIQPSLIDAQPQEQLRPHFQPNNVASLLRLGEQNTRETACAPDTVLYTLSKGLAADTLRGFGINNATNTYDLAGQWFSGHPGMTLNGVEMAARSGVQGANVTATVRVWASRADTFPDSLTYQETFDFPPSPTFQRKTFSTPVTINGDYIITVENTTPNTLVVFSNDYTLNRGAGENLSIVGFFDNGLNLLPLLNAFNITVDADWLFLPMVSYSIDAEFAIDPACLQPAVEATLSNQSSSILSDKMYNLQVFASTFGNNVDSTFFYDFGDGNSSFSDSGVVNHTFLTADSNSFEVTLDALMLGWSIGCVDTASRVYREGVAAGFSTTLTDDSLVVSSSATGVVDSITYDYGDGSAVTTDTSHIYSQIGTYTITQTVFGCGGPVSTTDSITISVASINGLSQQIEVFPNPSQGIFHVNLTDGLSGELNVKVTNLVGQEVFRSSGQQSVRVDLSGQVPGVYLLQGSLDGQAFTRKLIVE